MASSSTGGSTIPALASRDQEGGRRPPHSQRFARAPRSSGYHRQARRPRGKGRSDPARRDQAVRGAQGRRTASPLLAERRRPALCPGAPRRGGFRGHRGQRSPLLRGIQGQGRRSPGPRSPRGNPGRDRPDSGPLLAGNTAGTATPRAPPPLLRLLAGDHLPSRGNALFDPALRARAGRLSLRRAAVGAAASRSPGSSP